MLEKKTTLEPDVLTIKWPVEGEIIATSYIDRFAVHEDSFVFGKFERMSLNGEVNELV